MAQQIKHKLQTVAWLTGSAKVVFGTQQGQVAVFTGTPTQEQTPQAFPFCMVGIDGGDPDEDHNEFMEQRFSLLFGADVAGDPLGEFALIGGSTGNLGTSAGRGVVELAARVRAAVEDLTGADGARMLLGTIRTGVPTILDGKHCALSEITLTATCTSQLHYDAPQEIAHDGSDWTWVGTHCSNRFDFLQYRLYSVSGTAPSTAPGIDTLLYTGTAATFTGAATNGLTYTVFADYNGRGAATVEDSSEPEVGAYKAVVAP